MKWESNLFPYKMTSINCNLSFPQMLHVIVSGKVAISSALVAIQSALAIVLIGIVPSTIAALLSKSVWMCMLAYVATISYTRRKIMGFPLHILSLWVSESKHGIVHIRRMVHDYMSLSSVVMISGGKKTAVVASCSFLFSPCELSFFNSKQTQNVHT